VDFLEILTIDLIHVLTIFVFGGILLHYATGYLYFENRSYQRILKVIIIGSFLFFIFDFIPVFGVGFGHFAFSLLIKYFYNVEWVYAATAWFMSIFVAFMLSLSILIIFRMDILFMPNLA